MSTRPRPRFVPSEYRPFKRYSVPLNPLLASQMSSGLSAETLDSAWQQAWSLTTQSTSPASTCSHSASTSSRARIGGFTLPQGSPEVSMSASRCPMVTSRRKSTVSKHPAMRRAASMALADDRCSGLMLTAPVSWARYGATVTANPSEHLYQGLGSCIGNGGRRLAAQAPHPLDFVAALREVPVDLLVGGWLIRREHDDPDLGPVADDVRHERPSLVSGGTKPCSAQGNNSVWLGEAGSVQVSVRRVVRLACTGLRLTGCYR